MLLSYLDVVAVLSYVAGFKNLAALNTRAANAVLARRGLIYCIIAHVRLSTFFYGSGLTFITAADLLNGRTLVAYGLSVGVNSKLLMLSIVSGSVESVASAYSNAAWYERELSEFFGVTLENSEDTRTLLMPYNDSSNPLKKQQAPASCTATIACRRLAAARWFSL